MQSHLIRPEQGDFVHAGHEGGEANAGGGHPQQQVDHGGIAGDSGLDYVDRLCLHSLTGSLHKVVDGSDHKVAQMLAALPLAGVDDARDDILAAGDLLIILGHLGVNPTSEQIHQPQRHGGGADVHGDAPERVVVRREAGFQIDQSGGAVGAALLAGMIEHGGDLPIALAQLLAHGAQKRQRNGNVIPTHFLLQRPFQTAPIIGLVVHGGRFQCHRQPAHGLILQRVVARRDLHLGGCAVGGQSPLDLLLRRHMHSGIAFHHRLTTQHIAISHVLG